MQVQKCNIQNLAYLLQYSTETKVMPDFVYEIPGYKPDFVHCPKYIVYIQTVASIFSTYPLHTNIVGVGKRGAYELLHGDLPTQHSFGTIMAVCRRTLGIGRHRYAFAWPDKLGTDPMAYGGFK